MLIGYARVSKADGSQSLDLQRDALQAAGVDGGHVYHDFASGVRDDRPGLDSCVRALRTGDVLVVWKLDRLGRNLVHLVNTVQDLTTRGVGLRVLTGQGAQIDTTTAPGRLVFGIFAALAEFERELIRERTWPGSRPRGARTQGRQDVRAVESPGAAGPGRDGAPRHLRVRAVSGARDHPRDALPVRWAAGAVARARREGPRHLNRSALTMMSLESVANDRLRHMLIGYARVSKADGSQSLDLQRDARQDVRAIESRGAAGPGRDGAPRHLRVRTLP